MTRERCTAIISVSVLMLLLTSSVWGDVTLGTFNFNSDQFGDSLIESDGGAWSKSRWLNTVRSDPGNPGYLTGADFTTGIANIGKIGDRTLSYEIGYATPIGNLLGSDLGVVVARLGEDQGNDFRMAVSTDGLTFTSDINILAGSATDSTDTGSYYYGGSSARGPFEAALYVHAIDLNVFGLGAGASVSAIRFTVDDELDLIRAAGFGDPTVPVPGAILLAGLGAALVGTLRRRRSL